MSIALYRMVSVTRVHVRRDRQVNHADMHYKPQSGVHLRYSGKRTRNWGIVIHTGNHLETLSELVQQ